MIAVDEDRITEVEYGADDVPELERGVVLGEAELPDPYEPADGVRIGDARETQVRLPLRPAPGPRESFGGAADLVIRSRQLVPDRAVALRPAQCVGRMPRQRQSDVG